MADIRKVGFAVLCASLTGCPLSAAEVSYPPALPGGETVATASSDALLKPPSSLEGVKVASRAPTVDFMYYPGHTYEGNPWSNWGDSLAVNGKYYQEFPQKRRAWRCNLLVAG